MTATATKRPKPETLQHMTTETVYHTNTAVKIYEALQWPV